MKPAEYFKRTVWNVASCCWLYGSKCKVVPNFSFNFFFAATATTLSVTTGHYAQRCGRGSLFRTTWWSGSWFLGQSEACQRTINSSREDSWDRRDAIQSWIKPTQPWFNTKLAIFRPQTLSSIYLINMLCHLRPIFIHKLDTNILFNSRTHTLLYTFWILLYSCIVTLSVLRTWYTKWNYTEVIDQA